MTILVLCTGNSCRCQIVQGFLKTILPSHTILSADTEIHGLNPRAVETMTEIGIDISDHTSNLIDEYPDVPIDLVITVCDNAHESCPVFPGNVRRIHHGFKDPAAAIGSEEEIKSAFRGIREEIRQFCQEIAATYA